MNKEIRQFYNSLTGVVNQSTLPYELKRIVLEDLAKQCEVEANAAIQNELPVTEKGALEDGTELAEGT